MQDTSHNDLSETEVADLLVHLRGLRLEASRSVAGGHRTFLLRIHEEEPAAAGRPGSSSGGGASPNSSPGAAEPPAAGDPLPGSSSRGAAGGSTPSASGPSDGPGVGLEEDEPPSWLGPQAPKDPLPHVLRGAGRLSASDGLDGAGRLRRAYEAGRQAARCVRGDVRFPDAAPPLSLDRKFYIIVRAPGLAQPTWTKSRQTFKKIVGNPTAEDAIFFGVPSASEAQAYLLGLGITVEVQETR